MLELDIKTLHIQEILVRMNHEFQRALTGRAYMVQGKSFIFEYAY